MSKKTPISLRAHALALLEEGVHIDRIRERTGLCESAIYKVRQRAHKRGYHRDDNFIFKDEFFTDEPRSGRPREMDEDKEGN
jgi:transposase